MFSFTGSTAYNQVTPLVPKNQQRTLVSRRNAARLRSTMRESFPPLPKLQTQIMPSLKAIPNRGSYLDVASNRGAQRNDRSAVLSYSKMLLDPLTREYSVRYPDDTILPTALTHFTTSQTVKSTGSVQPSFISGRWKVADSTSTFITYEDLSMPAVLVGYGAPAAQWLPLDAIDRTLALGIRARVVGLPTSTFLPSGTAYFVQLQDSEFQFFRNGCSTIGEAVCIQAVTAGKGFSMTVNELSRDSGVTIPYLPQGPMSFVFSDAASAGAAGDGVPGADVVSPNGWLAVVVFGADAGLKIRYDFAHHVEYVPTSGAAGLIATQVCPPSIDTRESISKVVSVAQNQIAGSTSSSSVQRILDPSVIASMGAAVAGRAAGMAINGTVAGMAIRGASSMAAPLAGAAGAPAWLTAALYGLGY